MNLPLVLLNRRRRGGLDTYREGGFNPSLVFDFGSEFYRTSGSASTFDAAMTHSRAGNATMVDSDGLLKWAPHNLLTYSEDFSNATWIKNLVTISGSDLVIPEATLSYHFLQGSNTSSLYDYTNEFEAKPEGYNFVRLFMGIIGIGVDLDLVNKTFSNKHPEYADPVFSDSTDDFVKVSVQYIGTRSNKTMALQPMPSALSTSTFTGDGVSGVRFRKAHLYRSDLGGMVDNPDRGDSYVPTTSAARYLPRRGHHVYNGSAWVNEGVLHESEARTNLALYSNDLSNAAWSKNSASVSDPSLTLNGEKAWTVTSTGTSAPSIFQTATFGSGACCGSVLLKAGTLTTAEVRVGGGGNFGTCIFDLSAGTAGTPTTGGTGANALAYIEDIGGGVYRCSVSASNVGTGSAVTLAVYPEQSAATTTGSVFVTAGQFEAGSTPSSYIPTAGATVTRPAETITVPAANLPWPTEAPLSVSIQMDGRMTYADEDVAATATGATGQVGFALWQLNTSNFISQRISTDGVKIGQVIFGQREGASGYDVSESLGTAYSPGINVPFNIASRHGSTFINGAVDGVALTADTTPVALPNLSATDLNLAFDYMGTIRQLRIWNQDLGDAGIAEASEGEPSSYLLWDATADTYVQRIYD